MHKLNDAAHACTGHHVILCLCNQEIRVCVWVHMCACTCVWVCVYVRECKTATSTPNPKLTLLMMDLMKSQDWSARSRVCKHQMYITILLQTAWGTQGPSGTLLGMLGRTCMMECCVGRTCGMDCCGPNPQKKGGHQQRYTSTWFSPQGIL